MPASLFRRKSSTLYLTLLLRMGGLPWDSLILGNGASIALHRGFAYQTLHDVAADKDLLRTVAPIFQSLGTTDFERVLLACWYAERVNKALGTPSLKISTAYEEVRQALIGAVHSVHPTHADIVDDMQKVGAFSSTFEFVISLNYDLTFYWAMLLFNQVNGNCFKDAFVHRRFQSDWDYLRGPYRQAGRPTLVFYPHGNLALARDSNEDEVKLAGDSSDLLDTITRSWSTGDYVPLFVSEGTSQQKLAAIRRSHYLSNVYDKVLSSLGDRLVVYGWSFDDRDQHLLQAITKSKSKPKVLAVSVYTGQSEVNQQIFCQRVRTAVRISSPSAEVRFFDSQSPGCWNNPS